MSAADLAVLVLPRTRTYRRREAVWLPYGPDAGALQIKLQRAARKWRAPVRVIETDTYAVQERRDVPLPAGIRWFLLENVSDPDPAGPFECIVGGVVEQCGCEAGNVDRKRVEQTSCKHRDSVRQMIIEGVI